MATAGNARNIWGSWAAWFSKYICERTDTDKNIHTRYTKTDTLITSFPIKGELMIMSTITIKIYFDVCAVNESSTP